jgi:hypothetical protein
MEITSRQISDLQPAERQAAEMLLGRSLSGFHKIELREMDAGADVVVRFIGGELVGGPSTPGRWVVPASFSVLTDLSDAERADFDAAISKPVNLSG